VKEDVIYRGYRVHHDGTEYVAEPMSRDSEIFEIAATRLETLYQSIDELWNHLASAETISQSVTVPAWYQAWLDDGADGRVRILDCGRHESIAPKRRWWGLSKLFAGALVCAAAFAVAPKLDMNGDGSLNGEDWKAVVEKVYLKYPPHEVHHRVRWGKGVYDVRLEPAPEDDIDFTARAVVRRDGVLLPAPITPTAALNDR
jgi:hypothetical protein